MDRRLPAWIILSLLVHTLVLSLSRGVAPTQHTLHHPVITADLRYIVPDAAPAVFPPVPEEHVETEPRISEQLQPTPRDEPAQISRSAEQPSSAESYLTSREVDVSAEPTNDVLLRYPWVEYRLKRGGVVRITLLINEQGGLDKVTVIDATPPGVFEEAALEAVNKLQFTPALKGGRRVRSQKTIEVVFDPSEQFNQPGSM